MYRLQVEAFGDPGPKIARLLDAVAPDGTR